MTDETTPARGEAAWKEQREGVAKRNAEAHKRGQAERKQRDRSADAKERVYAAREAQQLDELNAQITARRSGNSQ